MLLDWAWKYATIWSLQNDLKHLTIIWTVLEDGFLKFLKYPLFQTLLGISSNGKHCLEFCPSSDLICGQIHVYFKIECFKMDREMTLNVKWQLTVASTLAFPLALGVEPRNASSTLWVWYILFIWHRNLLWYAVLDHKHSIGMCMWYVWHNLGFTLHCVRCGLICGVEL